MIKPSDRIRPYNTAMTDFEESVATILLYSDKAGNNGKDGEKGKSIEDFQGSIPTDLLEVYDKKNNEIPKLDKMTEGSNIKGDDYYGIFNNFSIQNLNESKGNITKIHQNFAGSWNAFFMGEKPETINLSGILLDSPEFPYYQEFVIAYDNYLSGQKCIQNKMRMILSIDGKIIDGYILEVKMNTASSINEPRNTKKINFSILVKSTDWMRFNENGSGGKSLNYIDNSGRYTKVEGKDTNFDSAS